MNKMTSFCNYRHISESTLTNRLVHIYVIICRYQVLGKDKNAAHLRRLVQIYVKERAEVASLTPSVLNSVQKADNEHSAEVTGTAIIGSQLPSLLLLPPPPRATKSRCRSLGIGTSFFVRAK